MKKFLACIVILFSLNAHAQLPMKDSVVFYEKIDTVTGTKDQLYQKSKLWLANTFNSSKAVIEIDDKENGQLLGKGNTLFSYKMPLVTATQRLGFTIKIDTKDNKYRIQIYDFTIMSYDGGYATDIDQVVKKEDRPMYKKVAEAINIKVLEIIAEFDAAIRKEVYNDF